MRKIKEILSQKEFFLFPERVNAIRIKTGIPSLDELIGGFVPGSLIVLGGRPGMGKTAFILRLILNQLLQGKKVAVYSLQHHEQYLIQRMLSIFCGIPIDKLFLQHDILNNKEEVYFKILRSGLEKLQQLPLYLSDIDVKIQEIEQKTIQLQQSSLIDIVYIDGMDILQHGYKNHLPTTETIHRLKKLAKKLQIPVVVTSQLPPSADKINEKKNRLSEWEDMLSLKNAMDLVALLYRPGYYGIESTDTKKPEASVFVVKNGYGNRGKVTLHYNNQLYDFADREMPNESLLKAHYFQSYETLNYLKNKLDLQ